MIGTGAGGLSAAAHLARQGFDVLALDQADRLGGFLAPFCVNGYTFDPGLHYVGQARRGQLLDRVLGELGIDVERLFLELDPDGFDVYRFPDLEVRMCRGLERYRDRLVEHFPRDRAGLFKLFDLVARMRDLGRTSRDPKHRLRALAALRHVPSVMRWSRASFGQLLQSLIMDRRARAVVAAACGDAGLPPSRLSALLGLGLLAHYSDGAFFPRGGGAALCDALVASARARGARFRTDADVAEILVRDGAVQGVRLANGERIPAEVVISDADPKVTFGTLLDPSALPGRLVRKIQRTTPSLATLIVFLGLKRDLAAHGLGAFNVWQYPSWDLDAVYAPLLAGELPGEMAYFLSSGTLRDDSGMLAPQGCSTLQIVTPAPWQPFARWAATAPGQRGEDYRELRERLAAQLLRAVDRHWPGLVGDVEVQRISTPLSNADYARAVQGGIYGPAQTPEQSFRHRFGTRTPVSGLYLAGAGALGGGVAICLLSGRSAAKLAARQTAERRAPAAGGLGAPLPVR